MKQLLLFIGIMVFVSACSSAPSPTATPTDEPLLPATPAATESDADAQPALTVPPEFDGPPMTLSAADDLPSARTINPGDRWTRRSSILLHKENSSVRVVFSVYPYTGDFNTWVTTQYSGTPNIQTVEGRTLASGDAYGRFTYFIALNDRYAVSYGISDTGGADVTAYHDDVRWMALASQPRN